MINFTLPDLTGPGSSSELPFASLYHANLSALDATVDQWAQVRDNMRGLNEVATRELSGGAARTDWTGENADVTRSQVRTTAGRFAFAYQQAHAIHSILHSLLESLVAGQKALLRLESTAAARSIAISAHGIAYPVDDSHSSPFSQAMDVLGPVPPETEQAVDDVQAEIRRILDTAAEADRLAARALDDMANSENGERFGVTPYHHWEDARSSLVRDDAEALIDLARDEDLSAADLRRIDQLLDDHADDPAFATHVIDSIGMESYLRFTERADNTAMRINSDGVLAAELRQGLGTTLTTSLTPAGDMATAPPGSPAFQQWLTTGEGRTYQQRYEAFQEAGRQPLLDRTSSMVSSDHRLGFDVALDLLEASEVPVDGQFFTQVMDDFIAMEREDPDIWHADRYPAHPDDPGSPILDYWNPENDLVDRMLGIGAHNNPDTVTAYFDPGETGNTSRLDYFIGEGPASRHAATRHDPLWQDVVTTPPGPGLAAALETAATGLSPGDHPPAGQPHHHTQANADIAEHIWNTFSAGYQGSADLDNIHPARISEGEPFAPLRTTLGHIAADYIPDIHNAVTGMDIDPRPEPRAEFDPYHANLMLFEVGMDPDAYTAITAANEAYTHVAVDHAVNASHETNASRVTAVEDSVTGGGQVAGLMTHAQATAVYEGHLAADAAYNGTRDQIAHWTDRILASTVDAYLDHKSDFWGPMAIQAREELTERFFGLFEQDSRATAEMQASREYSESSTYFREAVAAAAATDAVERGLVTLNTSEEAQVVNAAHRASDQAFDLGISKEGDHQ